ncbi:MAG TPA: isoprenylcysteine carboxylmethyltransferase family protein [Candidatus Acidoferrales bacterium]|jgi:methyltransferase|nr:isoprenylcysteine carboxylmethyltransferase family protein [Candidatus Acidoferrales bacterium]
MGVSQIAYLGLLAATGAGRLAEMRLSRRNQRRMISEGASRVSEPHFRWMVALHAGVLIGAAAEVIFLHRPLIPALAIPMTILFLLSNVLRWWVIRTLRGHWNVQVVDSARLGVVAEGPYRWIRHPNYAAVFVELVSLPLIYTAWITALAGAVCNVWVLHKRLALEDPMLLSNPAYRAAMGGKPKFFPNFAPRIEIPAGKNL